MEDNVAIAKKSLAVVKASLGTYFLPGNGQEHRFQEITKTVFSVLLTIIHRVK